MSRNRSSSGWEALGYGLGGGYERDRQIEEEERKTKRAELQLQAAEKGYSITQEGGVQPSPSNAIEQALLDMNMRLKQLQSYKAKQDTFQAFQADIEEGSVSNLNSMVNSEEYKPLFNSMGYNGIRLLNKEDPRDVQMVRSTFSNLGYSQDDINTILVGNEESPGIMADEQAWRGLVQAYPVLQKTNGQDSIVSMSEIYNGLGLHKLPAAKKAFEQSADRLAVVKNALNGKFQYMADIEKKQKEAEAKKTGAEANIKELEYTKMTDWFDKNPDKTFADYKRSVEAKPADIRKEQEASILDFTMKNREGFMKSIDAGTDITMSDGTVVPIYKAASLAQGDKDLSSGERTYFSGLSTAHKQFSNIYNKIDKGDIDWGSMEKFQTEVAKRAGEKGVGYFQEFKKLVTGEKEASPEEIRGQFLKILDRIELDSEVKTAMASYIKAMSGAAVSDQERSFYVDTITSGAWSTKESAMSSIKGFLTGIKSSFESGLSSIKGEFPKSYLDYKNLVGEGPTKKQETFSFTKQQLDMLQSKPDKFENRNGVWYLKGTNTVIRPKG